MATVHLWEINEYIEEKARREGNAESLKKDPAIEIRFDQPRDRTNLINDAPVDEDFKNKVITMDCAYGALTIVCDEKGWLRSIDLV